MALATLPPTGRKIAKFMKCNGFQRGHYNPCLYWNKTLKVKVLVHGDGFVSVGQRSKVQVFRNALARRFEVKTILIKLFLFKDGHLNVPDVDCSSSGRRPRRFWLQGFSCLTLRARNCGPGAPPRSGRRMPQYQTRFQLAPLID